MFKQNNTSQNGFTLIEILVSLVVIALIATVFLPLITNSFTGIVNNGKSSRAQYLAQKAMEYKNAGTSKADIEAMDGMEHINVQEDPTATLKIQVSGTDQTINGTHVEITYDDGEESLTLTSFIPNP